jgi:hypothetical protein
MGRLLFIFLLFAGSCSGQKLNVEQRQKVYDIYKQTSGVYLDSLLEKNKSVEYTRSQTVYNKTRFENSISTFEKTYKQRKNESLSAFLSSLNSAIAKEIKELPTGFYRDAETRAKESLN